MMVKRYPTIKEEVSSSIHGCEIPSLLDGKLARWSATSCALVLACWLFVSKNKIKPKAIKKTQKKNNGENVHLSSKH
jgi:hypothetical protein